MWVVTVFGPTFPRVSVMLPSALMLDTNCNESSRISDCVFPEKQKLAAQVALSAQLASTLPSFFVTLPGPPPGVQVSAGDSRSNVTPPLVSMTMTSASGGWPTAPAAYSTLHLPDGMTHGAPPPPLAPPEPLAPPDAPVPLAPPEPLAPPKPPLPGLSSVLEPQPVVAKANTASAVKSERIAAVYPFDALASCAPSVIEVASRSVSAPNEFNASHGPQSLSPTFPR